MANWHKTVIQEAIEGETEYLEINIYSNTISVENINGDIVTIDMETFELMEYLINQTE